MIIQLSIVDVEFKEFLYWCGISLCLFKHISMNVDVTKIQCDSCCNVLLSVNNASPPPRCLYLIHRPQLGLTNTVFERDYLYGAEGGLACSAPTDCDTYLMQTPVCLPCLIRAQCAGLGRGDPLPVLIAQPHIP